MRNLARSLESGDAVVGGVLSGTSGDGVDVAFARLRVREEGGFLRPAALEPLAFRCSPFPSELAERLRAVLDGAAPSLREVAMLHRDLGVAEVPVGEEAGEAAVLADLLLLFAADGARLAGDAARRLRSVRPPRLEESSAS